MLKSQNPKIPKSQNNQARKMYSFLATHIRKNKFGLAASSVMSAFSGLASIFVLRLVGGKISEPNPIELLDVFIMLLLAVFVFASGALSQFILNKIGQNTLKETRDFIVSKVSGASLECVEEIGHGKLISSLSQDANVISSSVLCIPQLVSGVFSVATGLVFMAIISETFLYAFVSIIIVGAVINFVLNRMASSLTREALSCNEKLFQSYKDIVDGVKEM